MTNSLHPPPQKVLSISGSGSPTDGRRNRVGEPDTSLSHGAGPNMKYWTHIKVLSERSYRANPSPSQLHKFLYFGAATSSRGTTIGICLYNSSLGALLQLHAWTPPTDPLQGESNSSHLQPAIHCASEKEISLLLLHGDSKDVADAITATDETKIEPFLLDFVTKATGSLVICIYSYTLKLLLAHNLAKWAINYPNQGSAGFTLRNPILYSQTLSFVGFIKENLKISKSYWSV